MAAGRGWGSHHGKDPYGFSALLEAAFTGVSGNLTTSQWLLEHGGTIIEEVSNEGHTVWGLLERHLIRYDAAKAAPLLRVMVLKSAPPDDLVALLSPEHVQVAEEGARLRVALPAYLARRRALLDAHCPLIAPLRALVRDYNPEPTTTDELWATGLGAAPQRARRPRPEDVVELSLRHSDRLRHRLE
jgi:hypothetical protein